MSTRPPRSTLTYPLFPYTTLFRSQAVDEEAQAKVGRQAPGGGVRREQQAEVLEVRHHIAYGRWGEAQPEAARQRARAHRGAGFHIGVHDVLQHLARAIVETLDRRGLGDGVQWLRHRLFSGPFFQVQAPLPERSDPPGRGQRGAQWALPRPGRPKRPQTGLNWTVATAWSSLPPAGGEPPRAPAGRLSCRATPKR